MSRSLFAWALVGLLTALGIAAQPHAMLNEQAIAPHGIASAGSVTVYLSGLAIALVFWQIARCTSWAWLELVPAWVWPVLATFLGAFFWMQDRELHLDGPGFYAFSVLAPLVALGMASLHYRHSEGTQDSKPILLRMPVTVTASFLWALGLSGLCVLLMAFGLGYQALFVPLLALLLPGWRKTGAMTLLLLVAGLLAALLSAPYRLHRFVESTFPFMSAGWNDANVTLGPLYQTTHTLLIMKNLDLFGSDTLIHLPRAADQLLAVSAAEHWGSVALAGIVALLALWFVLTRPDSSLADGGMRARFQRVAWAYLVLLALDNLSAVGLLLPAHGIGLPIFSPNWAIMMLVGLTLGARLGRTQNERG